VTLWETAESARDGFYGWIAVEMPRSHSAWWATGATTKPAV